MSKFLTAICIGVILVQCAGGSGKHGDGQQSSSSHRSRSGSSGQGGSSTMHQHTGVSQNGRRNRRHSQSAVPVQIGRQVERVTGQRVRRRTQSAPGRIDIRRAVREGKAGQSALQTVSSMETEAVAGTSQGQHQVTQEVQSTNQARQAAQSLRLRQLEQYTRFQQRFEEEADQVSVIEQLCIPYIQYEQNQIRLARGDGNYQGVSQHWQNMARFLSQFNPHTVEQIARRFGDSMSNAYWNLSPHPPGLSQQRFRRFNRLFRQTTTVEGGLGYYRTLSTIIELLLNIDQFGPQAKSYLKRRFNINVEELYKQLKSSYENNLKTVKFDRVPPIKRPSYIWVQKQADQENLGAKKALKRQKPKEQSQQSETAAQQASSSRQEQPDYAQYVPQVMDQQELEQPRRSSSRKIKVMIRNPMLFLLEWSRLIDGYNSNGVDLLFQINQNGQFHVSSQSQPFRLQTPPSQSVKARKIALKAAETVSEIQELLSEEMDWRTINQLMDWHIVFPTDQLSLLFGNKFRLTENEISDLRASNGFREDMRFIARTLLHAQGYDVAMQRLLTQEQRLRVRMDHQQFDLVLQSLGFNQLYEMMRSFWLIGDFSYYLGIQRYLQLRVIEGLPYQGDKKDIIQQRQFLWQYIHPRLFRAQVVEGQNIQHSLVARAMARASPARLQERADYHGRPQILPQNRGQSLFRQIKRIYTRRQFQYLQQWELSQAQLARNEGQASHSSDNQQQIEGSGQSQTGSQNQSIAQGQNPVEAAAQVEVSPELPTSPSPEVKSGKSKAKKRHLQQNPDNQQAGPSGVKQRAFENRPKVEDSSSDDDD